MLSKFEYDGALNPNFRTGEFALPVARIEGVNSANSRKETAKFVHVSSAGVTRPDRPGIDLEKACFVCSNTAQARASRVRGCWCNI